MRMDGILARIQKKKRTKKHKKIKLKALLDAGVFVEDNTKDINVDCLSKVFVLVNSTESYNELGV